MNPDEDEGLVCDRCGKTQDGSTPKEERQTYVGISYQIICTDCYVKDKGHGGDWHSASPRS